MKKTLFKLLSLYLALCMLLPFATACDGIGGGGEDSESSTPGHTCQYDREQVAEKYLKLSATCTEEAEYYYSCKCGKKGTLTFKSGEPLGHEFTNYVFDDNATCQTLGTKTAICNRSGCNEADTQPYEYGVVLDHEYEDGKCKWCKLGVPSEGLSYTLINNGTAYEVSGLGDCTSTDIVILDTYNNKPVTSIGKEAFRYEQSLTSIYIPSSVKSIGDYAFQGCLFEGISITGATSIGKGAFNDCWLLEKITLSQGLTSISADMFKGCNGLASIQIPSSVTTIGDYAFSSCTSLTSVSFDSGSRLLSIGAQTFYNCQSLDSMMLPDSLVTIGEMAFNTCGKLKHITIPDNVINFGDQMFYNCYRLEDVTIGESVTKIGEYTFYGCGALQSIYIPEKVQSIGESAFWECGALTSVTFHSRSQLTNIGNAAFYKCESLTSIKIPSGVTSIESGAFRGCSSLTIYCEAASKPSGWSSNWNSDNRPVEWSYKGN